MPAPADRPGWAPRSGDFPGQRFYISREKAAGRGPQRAIFGLSRVRSPFKTSAQSGWWPGHYFRTFPGQPVRLGSQRLETPQNTVATPPGGRAAGQGPARRHFWSSARPAPFKLPPPAPKRQGRSPRSRHATHQTPTPGGGIYGLALNPKRVNLGWYAAGICAGWEYDFRGAFAAPQTQSKVCNIL